jgi:hypothetical protein
MKEMAEERKRLAPQTSERRLRWEIQIPGVVWALTFLITRTTSRRRQEAVFLFLRKARSLADIGSSAKGIGRKLTNSCVR